MRNILFCIFITFAGFACNDELPIDTVIKKSSLMPTEEVYYAQSKFINDHLFRLSVKNLNKHEIGLYKAKPAWTPKSGLRATLKGKLTKYNVDTEHVNQDEYDWIFIINPDPVFQNQFGSKTVECEVTPSDNFHESPWFPAKDTDKPSPLLRKQLCLYGPWVNDDKGSNHPEIHPIDALWWREREESNDYVILTLVQDAAKGRFRNIGDYDFSSGFDGGGWVKWVNYPQEEAILIPFEYNSSGNEYPKIDIEELHAINVTTALKPEFVDSDNGTNHKLKLNENGAFASQMPTIIEVNEPLGKSLNLGVQFKEISIEGDGIIRGFISIKAAIGHPETKDEGVLVLKFHFSKGVNRDELPTHE
jgi:hypothetical protein